SSRVTEPGLSSPHAHGGHSPGGARRGQGLKLVTSPQDGRIGPKLSLPASLGQALDCTVANGGNAHVTWHNSYHHSDSDLARRHPDLGPQAGLGLWSLRHRRPDPHHPADLAAARQDLAKRGTSQDRGDSHAEPRSSFGDNGSALARRTNLEACPQQQE